MKPLLQRIGAVLLASSFVMACNSTHQVAEERAETPLAEQAAAVQGGQSDRIQLEQTPLADDDLRTLAELSTLRELLVDDARSQITARGIKHLAGLPKLEHLRIRSAIDSAALAALAELQSLHILNVPQGTFGDEALVHLKALPHLTSFRFGTPHVTDAGMKTIGEWPEIERLHLIDVPITAAGLAELAKIERLQSLYIDGAPLSDAALDELFRRRPGLHVHINQQHHDRDPHAHEHP